MKESTTTVGVRLKPPLLKRLDDEAKNRSVTRSECLRQITEEGLNDEKARLLLEEVRDLRQFLLLFDKRWKIGLVAILADAGKASVEDAEAFVRDNLS
jgi:metal-responsive CopG/Arc/MetJ family transcriptional regulator